MQTFLPYPSFTDSARVLDNRRLGKQRVETLQILKALTLPTYGWQSHPAVKMWRGFERGLVAYGIAICDEWRSRGFQDTCLDKIHQFVALHPDSGGSPGWLTPDLCLSHQSNLLRKDRAHYGPLFPNVPDDLPYVWPN